MKPALPVLSLLLLLPSPGAQTYVRVRDHIIERRSGAGAPGTGPLVAPPICATLPMARFGQTVPGGGSLYLMSFANPASVNKRGHMAFVADVTGAARNQGVFVADGTTVRPIVMGCGQGGGSGQHGTCGDPSPVGGTFAGFFGGTVFMPPINDEGDVLFFADVVNGTRPRGLFLHHESTQTITKVVAVGDTNPNGGLFDAIGPGAMNNRGEIAFLGRGPGTIDSDLFLWRSGTVSRIARAGDPALGGGTIALLGTESFGFVDGTNIPAGPVPAINDCGQLAFRVITNGGITERGIIVRTGSVDTWYLKSGDPTPVGGTWFDFQGAMLNGNGTIAVFSDYNWSNPTSGWFVGKPGGFRKALAFYDPVDGGQCMGLAFSRNPMTALDDQGNLLLWCDISSAGNQDRLVLSAPDGSLSVVARYGDATPIGGTFGSMNPWPSLSNTGRGTLSAGTPGAGGTYNAHFAAVLCGPALATSACAPVGGTLRADDYGPAGGSFLLLLSTVTTNVAVPPFGTLLIGPAPLFVLFGPAAYPGTSGPHTQQFPLPGDPALRGGSLHFQSFALNAPTHLLTNRATTVLQ